MQEESRFVPETVFEQTDAGPEPVEIGKVIVPIPLHQARTRVARPEAELRDALSTIEADTPQEAFEGAGSVLEGAFTDLDGEVVEVSLPVHGVADFTPDGLVRRHARLRGLYAGSRTGEAIASEPRARQLQRLEDEEVAALESVATILEGTLEEEDSR